MRFAGALLFAVIVAPSASARQAEKPVSNHDKALITGFDSWARTDVAGLDNAELSRSIPTKIVNAKYIKYLPGCSLDQSFHRYGSKRFAMWRCNALKNMSAQSGGELGAYFTFKSRGGINQIDSVEFFELQIIVT